MCICFAPSQAAWSPNPNPVSVRFCQGNQHTENSQLGVENRTKHTASLLLAAPKIPTGVFKMLPGKPSPGNFVLWTRQCFSQKEMNSFGMFSPEKQSPSMSPPLCAVWAQWLNAAPRWQLEGYSGGRSENTQQMVAPGEGQRGTASFSVSMPNAHPPARCNSAWG